MKILMLGFAKIKYMPYMNFCFSALKAATDVSFDIIYWDRDGKPDAPMPKWISKAYKYEAHLENQTPSTLKLGCFARYRRFALGVLKACRYDMIVIMQATPGLTLLDYLIKHYKGRYVLDFRDVSHENIPIYRRLVAKLANGSAVTLVSSDAFRKFLPKNKNIYTVHNYLEDSLNHVMIRSEYPRHRDVLRVSYWGLVRQVNVNRKIMDALGNDKRFELHYYGRMEGDGREMQTYAQSKNYGNVYFHGQYMPDERYDFAKKTDIIHNIYDCGHTMGNAMPNKFYDGIIFGIPQICTEGSFMGDAVSGCGVGLKIDLDSDGIADAIWNYYQSIDWKQFENNCENALRRVLDEQGATKEKLREVLGCPRE